MQSIIDNLPAHLRKYVVDQNYEKYTPEDQAAWRYIMRQLKDFLSQNAHPCYLEGLVKTGITLDRIPRIDDMNKKLQAFGWGAVPVSGFIPPAAFMEFQSLGILPIASDMRSVDHILYTPAPDIVHEAAGHAPILINDQFAAYLKKYADVARKAIISKQDLDQYEAIRVLSDVKENPMSSTEQIAQAETHLEQVSQAITKISEAGWLSRMNWWTAEYGLIGELNRPRIFGAGLLSSVSEAKQCLGASVKKIPLSIDCVDMGYDITEPQPQLYVTRDFETLHHVLEGLADRLAFRRGGVYGLERAQQAQTVNTVELDTGLQISGHLESFLTDSFGEVTFIRMTGPTQLCWQGTQLSGHGTDFHSHGYSTPLGPIFGSRLAWDNSTLDKFGLKIGASSQLNFASGITVKGDVSAIFKNSQNQPVIVQFKNCWVKNGDQVLFHPDWGLFDLALGSKVVSVFGGPADRTRFENTEDFVTAHVPKRIFTNLEREQHALFADVHSALTSTNATSHQIELLLGRWKKLERRPWLIGLDLIELARKNQRASEIEPSVIEAIESELPDVQKTFRDGLQLLPQPAS
jgi:phenylalanine-4-hydroxylase